MQIELRPFLTGFNDLPKSENIIEIKWRTKNFRPEHDR